MGALQGSFASIPQKLSTLTGTLVTFDHDDGLSGEHVESCFVYRPGWYEREDRSTLFEDKHEQRERRRLERGL